MGLGVGDERHPAVVGHVEPLVRVGRPRVGALDAGHEVAPPRARRRPQPERAVHVHPRARGQCSRRTPAIGSIAPVFTLPTCAHTIAGPPTVGERRLRPRRARPVVDRDRDRRGAEAEQAQRTVDGDVALLTGEHADAGRAGESVALDVPARALEDAVARRGQPVTCAIWHPVTNPNERLRQPEEVEQPAAGDLLARPPRRRTTSPAFWSHAGQPVGGERGGQRAADDEAEEAPARYRHDPRSAAVASCSITPSGSSGSARNGPPRACHNASTEAGGQTGRRRATR